MDRIQYSCATHERRCSDGDHFLQFNAREPHHCNTSKDRAECLRCSLLQRNLPCGMTHCQFNLNSKDRQYNSTPRNTTVSTSGVLISEVGQTFKKEPLFSEKLWKRRILDGSYQILMLYRALNKYVSIRL